MAHNYTYWKQDGFFVGYLDEYPEYSTQGTTLDELKYMLGDILDAIRVGDLEDTHVGKLSGSLVCA